jgi:tetratricopeptide (TPR) repeat protein
LLEEHPGEAPVEQARILNDTGWIYFRRGDLDRAEELLTRALKLAEPRRQYDVIASIYNRLGGIFFQRDQTELARDYVQRSLALRERIGDIVAVARTYNNLGLLDRSQGNWQAALDNFNRAYQFQVNLGDVEAMIELESNMGLLQIDRDHFDEAETHLQAALDRARQIGHSYQMGLAYLHLTLLCVTSGEWQRALDYGEQSLVLFNNIGVREHLLGLHAILGLAWLGQGSLEKAEESGQLAEAIYTELGGEASGRVDDYARLVFLQAEIASVRSEDDKAALLYQKSVTLFEQTGDRLQSGRSLLRLSGVLARSRRIEEARECFGQARSILEQAGSSRDLQRLSEMAVLIRS